MAFLLLLIVPGHTIVVDYFGFRLVVHPLCPYFHFRTIIRVNINGFSPNLVFALILLRSGLGLLMCKFLQPQVICPSHDSFMFLLAHLSRRLRMSCCDHYSSLVCQSFVCGPPTPLKTSSLKPLSQFSSDFSWSNGVLKICTNSLGPLIKMTAIPIYGKNT